MPAVDEICDIYKEIANNKLSYCIVCLRTENERKIVVSESLVGCLGMLRMRVPVYKTLCYVCESSLGRALRFIHALHFAGVINGWFRSMRCKVKYDDIMPDHLAHITQAMTFGKGQPLEEFWPSLRSRTQLAQTEPLLVNSQGMTHEVETETVAAAPPAPDPPPPSSADVQQIITIPDDEDSPLVPMSRLLRDPCTRGVSLTPGANQLMARDGEPGTFAMHPIVQGQDKVLYIPSLNGKLDNGVFLHVDPDTIQQNVTHHLIPSSQDRYLEMQNVIHQIIPNSEETYLEINGQTVRLKVRDKCSVSDNVDCGGDGDCLGDVVIGKCESVAQQAVMSASKVDWEDKIPMDVISFVDATDPNADQFLTRDPLGDPSPPSALPSLTPTIINDPLRVGHNEKRAKKSRLDHYVIDLC